MISFYLWQPQKSLNNILPKDLLPILERATQEEIVEKGVRIPRDSRKPIEGSPQTIPKKFSKMAVNKYMGF